MTPAQTPIAELIRGRRTINDFRPGRPPDDLVLQAIELARWAPNHKLTQPWRFHVIGPRTAEAIIDLNSRLVAEQDGPAAGEAKRRRWSAVPGWLAVTCVRAADPLREREDYAACCCAIQNLSLSLWSEGVGVKWSTGPVTRSPEFLSLLGLPGEGHSVVGLFWYGWPERVPVATRHDLDRIVQVLP